MQRVAVTGQPVQQGLVLAGRRGDPGVGLAVRELRRLRALAGLPLARALVEANKAQFAIMSEPGKGTTARIILPPSCVFRPDAQSSSTITPTMIRGLLMGAMPTNQLRYFFSA